MILQMPDSYCINSVNLASYELSTAGSGLAVTLTNSAGGTHQVVLGGTDTVSAIALMSQISVAMQSPTVSDSTVVQLTANGLLFTGCSPSVLTSLATNQQTLVITGTGFDQTLVGATLHLEDFAGGADDNGFTYTVSEVVNSTTLIAVYATAGDATVSPVMLLYYRDSRGVISNMYANISAT